MSERGERELSTPSLHKADPADADDGWAWRVLAQARERALALDAADTVGFAVAPSGELVDAGAAGAIAELGWRRGRWVFASPAGIPPLIDLYLPVCAVAASRPLAVGHLGQSLDGYIATASGDSDYVTGPANILHLHRMRALCDAVLVGAGTAASDDPRLTTRLAEGRSPVRVVLDPKRRLSERLQLFRDGQAPTLLIAARSARGSARHGLAEVLEVRYEAGRFELAELVGQLNARGLNSLFVEGGGTTVSAFLDAGLLDRLQVAIAAMVTGRGRPGLRLSARDRIADCLRPAHRSFAMGRDLLFDCDLTAAPEDRDGAAGTLKRIN